MSVVANTKIEGGELPPELLDGFFLLMVIAGNETTRNTLTGGLMALTDNPEEREKLLKEAKEKQKVKSPVWVHRDGTSEKLPKVDDIPPIEGELSPTL